MNIALKVGLLATGLGLAMNASNVQAAITQHEFDGNAINYCQAFTPGPTNTIRNRVLGAENVGTATISVACDWSSLFGDSGTTDPEEVDLYFSNTNATGSVHITCTLLTGYQTEGGAQQWTSTKSIDVPAGTQGVDPIFFDGSDNPTPTTSLNNWLIGVNCAVPHGGVINDTYFYWHADDGV